jgi:hypothetical protein
MNWECSTHNREEKCMQDFSRKSEGKRATRKTHVERIIILKWILRRGLDSSGSGPSEHDNEPSGSIKCWQFLEWLSNFWLLRKGSASCSYVILSLQVSQDVMFLCNLSLKFL